VVSIYEDFQCPHCAAFEKAFGPTLSKLIDSGAVAVDYVPLAILNSPINDKYSTRAANAAFCVSDADDTANKDGFRRFHAALFAQQPPEGAPAPNDEALIETARQSGVGGSVAECVNGGNYSDMVNGLAKATKVTGTPTVRINGEDYKFSTPDALIGKVKEIVGDVPALDGAAASVN
jgi:protein-disulfide isomerase